MPSVELNILLWNLEGDCGADKTETAISKILEEMEINEEDTFILAQEIKTKKKHKMFEQTGIPVPLYNEEAVVYYNSWRKNHKVQYLDPGLSDDDDDYIEFSQLDRLQATIVDDLFLLISWHGKYKCAESICKEQSFEELIQFAEKLRERKRCLAVLIGGDFNFHAYLAEDNKELEDLDGTVIVDYDQPRERRSEYDYLVTWSPKKKVYVDVMSTKVIPTRRIRDRRPFDHPVVLYKLKIHVPAEYFPAPTTELLFKPRKRKRLS